MDAAQTALVALMGEALIAESAGIRITRFCASGSVDYPALLKALLPALAAHAMERFRRKPAERVRVTVQQDAEKAIIPFDANRVRQAADKAVAGDFWF